MTWQHRCAATTGPMERVGVPQDGRPSSGLSALRKDMTIGLGSAQIIGMGLLFAAPELT